MNRWLFLIRNLGRELWVRASVYTALAFVTALLAGATQNMMPSPISDRIGGESVGQILSILASSMLAVTTFSLAAMVTAYTAVSQAASPRVAELVTSDDATQQALATFVGVFLFSIIGLTALNARYYGAGGRSILFLMTIVVVAMVSFRLLSWIGRLSRLARVGHMIELVEEKARDAMEDRLKSPRMGGREGHLRTGMMIAASKTGFLRNIDHNYLQALAEKMDTRIEVLHLPGHLIRKGEPLFRIERMDCEDEESDKLAEGISIGMARSFEQDPRFGLVVLGEIAGKALSPGINDPGTAVQVIASGLELMTMWAAGPEDDVEASHPRLLINNLYEADMLDDIFGPLMRYGVADAIVAVRLQKTLLSLVELGGPVGRAARDMADDARARSLKALPPGEDRRRLREVRG